MNSWLFRQHSSSRIDNELIKQINVESEYWCKVLQRVVATVKFLCERGLAIRGETEVFGMPNNGNYLGILELISQFDPFLKEHINKYGSQGKGKPSYLSKTICEELINLMGEKVLKTIIAEIKQSKYYSLIVDSPDCTHIDQLSIVCRYIYLGEIKERFLCFQPIESHKGKYLFEEVKSFLKKNDIPVIHCRGISTDNAANMSGQYEGFQAQIKKENKFAQFVPCAGHSLNLVGVNAVESCLEALNFFSYLQKLYVYFSNSPRKWALLSQHLEPKVNEKLIYLKSICTTRWCCHYESVKALYLNYDNVLRALETIIANTDEKLDSKREATSLLKKFSKFESLFMCALWHDILERFDTVSSSLQKPTLDLITGCNLLQSLSDYLKEKRNHFEDIKMKACSLSQKASKDFEQSRIQKKKYIDGNNGNEVTLTGEKKFLTETFYTIMDKLCVSLNDRKKVYENFYSLFNFLIESISFNTVDKDSLENCLQFYKEDLDENLSEEIEHFSEFIKNIEAKNCQDAMKYMHDKDLIFIFPNVYTALKLYLVIPLTNCEAERSFSKLKLIKNRLRSSMLESRLSGLTLMSLEHDITKCLSFDDVVESFAKLKARKRYFN